MALKDLNSSSKVFENENVIVGSGAGGSTAAFELLKRGKECLILEEGPDVSNLKDKNVGCNIINLYQNNGATPLYSFNGGPLIGYGQGSCVGGSTYVNAGYFSNTPEWVYEKWIEEKKINMTYLEFQNLFKELRTEIGVSTENLSNKDGASKILVDLFNQKKIKIEKCERFSDGVADAEKNNMNKTYHKELFKKNVDIIHNCKVIKIYHKEGIAYKLAALNKLNNKCYEIKFKNLFLSCGPINTPHLLLKNKLIQYGANQNNFEFHINLKILVKFKRKFNHNSNVYDPNNPVGTFFMREFEKEGHLLSSANSELSYLLATASHFDEKVKNDIFKNLSNYAMYVYQIRSNSKGKIKNFFGIPFVAYKFNKKDHEQIKLAFNRLSKFFLDYGIEQMYFPIEGSKSIQNQSYSKDLISNFKTKKLHLVSVHGMGSLRSGAEDNVHTDYHGKLKNFNNIFINDASILPGNTGESPQASVMAMVKNNIKNIKL